MSSKTYGDERTFTGVLDDNFELTPLADANKAYLPYCSSDSHMGDVGPTDELPLQFRGQRIVRAVVEHLRQRQGLGNALNEHEQSTEVLVFGGWSAGARGAMVALDYYKYYLA
jgi:hypothetical protein